MKDRHFYAYLLVAALVTYAAIVTVPEIVRPAMAAPPLAKDPDPEECPLVATAGGIEVYYCEDVHLFINQLGFMAFEP